MSDSDTMLVELRPGQNVAEWLDIELRKLQEIPKHSIEELQTAVEALRLAAQSAITQLSQPDQTQDHATGVGSRRAVQARLAMEWERSRRYGRPLSVVAIEVNQMGAADDGDGRTNGATPIRSVASRLVETVRGSDFVGRIVGDEFVLICPEADEDAARGVTSKVIDLISAGPTNGHDGNARPRVTAGWATRRGDQTADELLQDADRALAHSSLAGGGTTQGAPVDRLVRPGPPRDDQAEREAHYKWMKRR